MVRIVRTPAGIRLDLEGGAPGRGTYVCAERSCRDRAAERGGAVVRRAIRGGETDEILAALAAVPIAAGPGGNGPDSDPDTADDATVVGARRTI
jgi:hypothetical protein